MHRLNLLVIVLTLSALTSAISAQEKSLAATLDTYVFPSDGQDSAQQSKDEAECYQWAVSNTGNDPFELAKKESENEQQAQAEQQAAQQVGRGAGARGAVGGAAAGAIIGEIANDDASKGAAYGAALGAVASRRRGHQAQQQAVAQSNQQADQREQMTTEQMTNFKKAFSVCLEAKDYMVKY